MSTNGAYAQLDKLMAESLTYQEAKVRWKLLGSFVSDTSIDVTNLNFIKVTGDFVADCADYNTVSVNVSSTTYFQYLVPNADKLKFVLRQIEVDKNGNEVVGGERRSFQYKAVLYSSTEQKYVGKRRGYDASQEQLGNQLEVLIQLIPEVFDEMRKEYVGSSARACTQEELMGFWLGLRLEDTGNVKPLKQTEYTGLRGVNIVKPDNTKRYGQIILPENIKVKDLPLFLQNEMYGVYNNGIGRYFLNGFWYVYPLFDHQRFTKEDKTVTIVVFPPDHFADLERSFYIKTNHLTIFTSKVVVVSDPTQKVFQNEGNATRFYSADGILNSGRIVKDGIVTSSAATLDNKISIKERDSGGNTYKYDGDFTSNTCKKLSTLSGALGTQIMLTWNRSVPVHLHPGMPVRILTVGDNQLDTTYGTLIGRSYISKTQEGNSLDPIYMTTTTLMCHVEKFPD